MSDPVSPATHPFVTSSFTQIDIEWLINSCIVLSVVLYEQPNENSINVCFYKKAGAFFAAVEIEGEADYRAHAQDDESSAKALLYLFDCLRGEAREIAAKQAARSRMIEGFVGSLERAARHR